MNGRILWMATVLGVLQILQMTASASEDSSPMAPTCHWSFDGTLETAGGSTRDALVSAGVATPARFVSEAEVPGISGRAIALGVAPGDAQYLIGAVTAGVTLGPEYTIQAWIHPTSIASWNRLVLRWSSAPQYAYHLALHDGRASLYHGQLNGTLAFAEGGRVQPGRWYLLTGVARRNPKEPSKSVLEAYLNGRLVGSAPFDGTIARPDKESFGIGDSAGAPSASSRFRGYVDDLAVWHRALGPQEIQAAFDERAETLQELERVLREREMAERAETVARIRKLGVDEIVFAERAIGRDPQGHYYANFGYSCTDPNLWIHGEDGGRLVKLDLRTGELTVLLDDPLGAVRDPQVHYDAHRILFSYRKGGTHCYNLYEIRADGSSLRQITRGEWDDVEPTYLPDGDIVFCSTRCNRYIGCWLAPSAILFRCSPSGSNLRMLSSGAFTENTPAILADGRVLYTRWEYVNRDPVSFHHLWTMNPDGTRPMVYFGNQEPGGVFIDAKPIPDSDRVVMIHSPGHGANEHAGSVTVISSRYGPNARSEMRTVSRSGGFRDPFPLSEDEFLVAHGSDVLLMSSAGETEVLYSSPTSVVHEPCPVARRPRERIVPPAIDLTRTTGTLVVNDVYVGRNLEGIQPGDIRKLLVLEDLPKPANFHGGGSQPIGHGVTSTLKRILGTVPVEPDGSACFEVPALRSLYFVALGNDDVSVKQMRSFVTLQPGETVGCVGCHEPRTRSPGAGGAARLQALRRSPSVIEPVAGVPMIPEFSRDVQPILDRHCVPCHGHEKREGGVSLVGDRGPVFSHSYYELFVHWQVKDTREEPRDGSGRQPGNDKPYTTYSSASALMRKIDGSHHEVQTTALEAKRIRLWIDSGAQYPGTYAAYGTGQVGGCWDSNRPVRVMADGWPTTAPSADAIERRCGACHPRDQLPRHVTDQIPLDSWGDMLSWVRPLSRYSRHRLYNLSRPEQSLVLRAPLARRAGGLAEEDLPTLDGKPGPVREDRGRPPRPIVHPVVFASRDDPDYRRILAHVEAAGVKLDEIKRFDMPGFRPNEHYIREMKRFGVLPPTFDADRDPIDVYATDEAYWRSFWPRPLETAAAD